MKYLLFLTIITVASCTKNKVINVGECYQNNKIPGMNFKIKYIGSKTIEFTMNNSSLSTSINIDDFEDDLSKNYIERISCDSLGNNEIKSEPQLVEKKIMVESTTNYSGTFWETECTEEALSKEFKEKFYKAEGSEYVSDCNASYGYEGFYDYTSIFKPNLNKSPLDQNSVFKFENCHEFRSIKENTTDDSKVIICIKEKDKPHIFLYKFNLPDDIEAKKKVKENLIAKYGKTFKEFAIRKNGTTSNVILLENRTSAYVLLREDSVLYLNTKIANRVLNEFDKNLANENGDKDKAKKIEINKAIESVK